MLKHCLGAKDYFPPYISEFFLSGSENYPKGRNGTILLLGDQYKFKSAKVLKCKKIYIELRERIQRCAISVLDIV